MHYKRYAESYERKYFPSNNNLKFVRADSSLNEKFTNWTKNFLGYLSFSPNYYDYEIDFPCSPGYLVTCLALLLVIKLNVTPIRECHIGSATSLTAVYCLLCVVCTEYLILTW